MNRTTAARGNPNPRPIIKPNSSSGSILNVRNMEFNNWVGCCSEDGTLSGWKGRSGEI
jgi:hypothetical protein